MTHTHLFDEIDPLTIMAGKGMRFEGVMDEADRLMIASRFDFQDVRHISFDLTLKLISKDCWELRGIIKAKIIQNCVVTAKPVKDAFESELIERFVTNFEENEEIDVASADVEPLANGKILLKEAVVQFVGLSANPYPRSDGAPQTQEFGPKIEKENPFSKLSHLKK
ncbi:MAG: YceD family protein [Candidatus Puniceispirillaceae bacterium]